MITPAARALALLILRQPEHHPAHRRHWAWCTLKFASGKPVRHDRLPHVLAP